MSVSTGLDAYLSDAERSWLPKRCAFLKYYSMDKIQKGSCIIKFSHALLYFFFLHMAIWQSWLWFGSARFGSMLHMQI